jgi:leucyl aminopeptidase
MAEGAARRVRQAATAQGFKAEGYQLAILPGERSDWSAVLGVANVDELSPWCLAKAAEMLPEGAYRVEGRSPGPAGLGWLLGQYRFDRYKKDGSAKGPRILFTDEPAKIEEMQLLAEATSLVRDLVNMPAGDLGPAELEAAVAEVAKECSTRVSTTSGEELEREYPMIHAVGRAASGERAPRLIELEWGDQRHPRIAIVGKGVCFDSGGFDIKPASGMRLMKKDMGGAAHALGLALLIMKSRLPVRLPPADSRCGERDFRKCLSPRRRLKSRKGLSVEIGNTDAEGRLILGTRSPRPVRASRS